MVGIDEEHRSLHGICNVCGESIFEDDPDKYPDDCWGFLRCHDCVEIHNGLLATKEN